MDINRDSAIETYLLLLSKRYIMKCQQKTYGQQMLKFIVLFISFLFYCTASEIFHLHFSDIGGTRQSAGETIDHLPVAGGSQERILNTHVKLCLA